MFGTLTANSKHSVNRLINGGFYRVVVPVGNASVEFNNVGAVVPPGDPSAVVTYPFSKFTFEDGDKIAPTLSVVPTKPNETLIAGWFVYGVSGQVELRPVDPVLRVPVRGIYGPTPARFTLHEDGIMVVEQPLDDPKWWGLLDRDMTLSFVMQKSNSAVSVTVEADYGVSTEQLVSKSSRGLPAAGQIIAHFKPPQDATQFILRWKISGKQDASVYLGEAMLQLGYAVRPRFTDDISALGRPRGMVFFFNGTAAPPGYVVDCEAAGRFLFPTAGDARTDGFVVGRNGGTDAHDHNGRTSGRLGNTKILKDDDGGSTVNKNHRHAIEDAAVDPPWHKILIIQKV
jgi:hypothetical protein